MHIVTNEAKPKVFKELSPFQIGAVPGHRAQEHLFSIKSIIAMVEMTNDTIGLQLFDCSKMFDREVLVDCMDELYKSNIKGKLYKLIFEMNRDVRIRFRTPVGESNVKEVGKTVAQGSLEGALVSTNSVGNGVNDFFKDSDKEVEYGTMKVLPLQYVDDIGRLTDSPESAQYGNDKLENLAEIKLLDYNLKKCSILIFGKRKAREELRMKFEEVIPTLYGEKVTIKDQETYLGDQLGFRVAESVSLTIKKRIGLIKKSIYEVRAVVEDCRSKVIGGIKSGVLLWESCLIPFLLYNCST